MRGIKKYLIISGILLVAYLVAQYYKPKPTNWFASYLTEDKIPFGTYILHQRIQDIFPGTVVRKSKDPIYNTLKANAATNTNYLIIASGVKVNKLDFKEMVRFMQRGNNIFVSAFQMQGMLLDTLKLNISADFDFSKKRKSYVNFSNPNLRVAKGYTFEKSISEQYFRKIDSSKAIVLGNRNNKEVNFVQYKFGKGSLFLMPNPQLLTNYSLLTANGSEYASKALSYLPKAKTLIWDEHFTRPSTVDTSPLRLIFRYDSLRWAYYISVFGLLIFVLFEIKRRQRIIPSISRLTNTSVEFVKVVGRVYYQQRNNRDIAEKKVKYLLEYIRTKYRLRTIDLNQELKESLIHVSGASAETIESLFIEITHLKRGQMVHDKHLIELNKIIEQFYKEDQ
ncbi:DUF4350 domain-containing protein [Pedobacter yonginense]|uniref:DUF4350 domain-containing protein n=1 Tax=Pedobacter yonginense TaxID=651869 RepID=A0A317EQF5_9SPHI|nr:DUF4350 domain-containing protein [Pedobacter yonginense]PWS28063.1 DUF4350 domain-containing protein [Pedobacter yonginense]